MSDERELIKERLDLAQLVGEYVQLKPMGPHMRGLCPFHQEKSPSFIVSPTKGIWHCFGCGEGGDAFSFVQKIEGLDFVGALKLLAERTGVELTKRSASPAVRDHRQHLFDLLALAARFYHEILVNQAAGQKALDYVHSRGITDKTIKDFQIGYAPPGWDNVQRFLRKKNISPDMMIEVGLVGRSGQGKLFDRFRGRIMFPIRDVQGRVIAFGGRITPFTETGNEGKYVNSPETGLYSKRRVIYNLDRAKLALRHNQPCLVVEGYMDVVMLVQAGVEHVVASSGTAFTQEQITQLQRFTPTLHFAFDADAAGWKAALSATEQALAAGMKVATITFPAGQDPADVALKTPEQLPTLLNNPQSLIALMLDRLKSGTTDIQTSYQELLPWISRVANPIQQGEMIQDLANRLHVPEAQVIKMIPIMNTPVLTSVSATMVSPLRSEHHLLGLLLVSSVARQEIWPQLSEEFFLDVTAAQLYKTLQDRVSIKTDFLTMSSDEVVASLPSELISFAEGLRALVAEQEAYTNESASTMAGSLLRSLKQRYLTTRLAEVQQQLGRSSGDDRALLLQQIQELAQLRQETKV